MITINLKKFKKESWMPDIRTTDYEIESEMEIIDTHFHNYPIGEIVIIKNKDLFSYHVCNKSTRSNWWWVKENQIKPLK